MIIALAMLAAAPLTEAQVKVLQVRQTAALNVVVAMDDELAALKKNRDALAASPKLMAEEIRSIRARFADAKVQDGATVDETLAALAAERKRFGDAAAANEKPILDFYVDRACKALGGIRSGLEDIYNSPGWLSMSLDQRLDTRQSAAKAIQGVVGDDPDTRAKIEAKCSDLLTVPQ